MNTKYFVSLTAILLATGLSPPITHAQTSQLAHNSMFNDALVQLCSSTLQPISSAPPPPPVDGKPGDTVPAGSRAK